MTAKEHILAGLTHLQNEGALAKSACSFALLRAIEPLLDAGVVVEEPVRGGRRLTVRDPETLLQFARRHFPDTPAGQDQTSRAAGVARFRNSKTFASDTPEILSVRAWAENALLKNGGPAGAVRASSEHGVFSFMLNDHYSLRGTCALVENPAVFSQFERLRLPIGLVISSGRGLVSRRLLDWLAANGAPDFSLLHLPDYDPVGMVEFTRLRERLGERVHLHLPADLAEQFARFSTPVILKKASNRAMLANLRESELPEVRRVIALIDTNNACLEQESLLLTGNPPG